MTRIEELEKEIELTKELIRLKKELNNIPQYQPVQYPWYPNPYGYPTTWYSLSSDKKPGDVTIHTTGYIQGGLKNQVDGPISYVTTTSSDDIVFNSQDKKVGWGG